MVGAGFERGVDAESVDAACGSFAYAVFDLHEDGGACVAIDESGADDPDDAGMPILVSEDDGACVVAGHPRFDRELFGVTEDALFCCAALFVE